MFATYFIWFSFLMGYLVRADFSVQNIFDKFHQHEFKHKFEWVELVSYNKEIVKKLEVVIFKHNRTCAAMNATLELNIDVGNDVEVVIQSYKFMSNEYRYFPLRFQVNACFAVSKNLGGISDTTACGNFSGCPLRKGIVMHVCNWKPDDSKFPPGVPSGRYMTEFQFLYKDTEMAIVKVYGEITRPEV